MAYEPSKNVKVNNADKSDVSSWYLGADWHERVLNIKSIFDKYNFYFFDIGEELQKEVRKATGYRPSSTKSKNLTRQQLLDMCNQAAKSCITVLSKIKNANPTRTDLKNMIDESIAYINKIKDENITKINRPSAS